VKAGADGQCRPVATLATGSPPNRPAPAALSAAGHSKLVTGPRRVL